MSDTLFFTKTQQEEYLKANREIHFHSKLGFFNSNLCPRKGNMHLFIAGTGAGKSTLTRTIITDLILRNENNCLLGLWLSEETVEEYRSLFSMGAVSHDRLLNTCAHSEQGDEQLTATGMKFFEWLDFYRPEILIFDNITTSKMYMGKRPSEQDAFADKLKQAIKKHNIAGIVIAHADSNQTTQKGGLLDVNNIRYSRGIVNLTEFAYLVQTFVSEKSRTTTLRIVKSRSQEVVHDTYVLNYLPEMKAYVSDTPISFEKFKEAYNSRNKL